MAKGLLDDAARVKAAASTVASAAPIPLTSGVTIERLLALLRLREASLLATVGAAMAAAARNAASGGKGAAAAAATAAFEENLDRVVALGWANVDVHCAERFAAAVAAAPAGLVPALRALQALHAVTRVEREVRTLGHTLQLTMLVEHIVRVSSANAVIRGCVSSVDSGS